MSKEDDVQRALREEAEGTISPKKKEALDKLRALGKIPGQAQVKQEPPKASSEQYLWNSAKKGLVGLTGIAGEAVDLAHNIVGGPKLPNQQDISVGDIIRQGWGGLLGVQNMPAPSKNVEVAGKGVESLVTALPTAPYVAARAARPGLALYGELMSGVGQAAGRMGGALLADPAAELGEKYGLDPNKVRGAVEGSGEMLGAFTPIGTNYLLNKGMNHGMQWWEDSRFAGNRAANKALREGLDYPGAMENISRAQDVSGNLGLTFDLAQAAGTPGLRVLARQVAEESPGLLNRQTARYEANLQALDKKKGELYPETAETGLKPSRDFSDEVERRLREGEEVVKREYAKLTEDIRPSVAPDEVGAELRTRMDEAYTKTRAKFDSEYSQLATDADKAGVRVDMTDIVNHVKTTFGTDAATYQRPDMPSVFKQIYQKHIAPEAAEATASKVDLDALQGTMSPQAIEQFVAKENVRKEGQLKRQYVSFNEFRSLMRETSKDVRLSRNRQDFAPGYLRDLDDIIHKELDEIADSSPSDIGSRLKDINSRYRKDLVEVFKKGAGAKLGQEGRFGEAVKDEDIVTKQFFKPNTAAGSAAAMEDFDKLFGSDPRARTLLQEGVLNVLTGPQGVLKDGVVDAGKLKAFQARYSNALSKNPDLAKRVRTVGDTADLIAERNEILHRQGKEFRESAFAQILGMEPAKAIEAGLKNPKEFQKVINLAQTPNAKAGLMSALAEHIFKQPDPHQFLKNHEAELKTLFNQFGPGHWRNIVDLAEAETILSRNVPPQSASAKQQWDLVKDFTGISLPSGAARWRAVRQGRSSGVQEAISAAAEVMGSRRKEQYIKALEEAIYNPDLAMTLANLTKTKTPSQAQTNKIYRHLLSAGIRVSATEDFIPAD